MWMWTVASGWSVVCIKLAERGKPPAGRGKDRGQVKSSQVKSRRRLVESDSSIVFTLHSCRTGRRIGLDWVYCGCRGYGVSDECLA